MTHVKSTFQHPLFFAPSGANKKLKIYAWTESPSGNKYALEITEVRYGKIDEGVDDVVYLKGSFWNWNNRKKRWEGGPQESLMKPFESNPSRNPIPFMSMPATVNYKKDGICNIRALGISTSMVDFADAPPLLLKHATHVRPWWWGDTWPVIVQYEEDLTINLK